MSKERVPGSHLSWWRLDCLAGHVRFELRNVVANYPFERSRGFPGSEPNSGQGDHSRLSCSAGDTQLGGWVLPGSLASVLHGRWPSCGVAERHELAAICFDQKMIRRRQSQPDDTKLPIVDG